MEQYYIQNGYVGNALCWWRENSRGYTTNLEEAGKYSRKEADTMNREDDVPWPCSYIDACEKAKKVVVDAQYLDFNKRL